MLLAVHMVPEADGCGAAAAPAPGRAGPAAGRAGAAGPTAGAGD